MLRAQFESELKASLKKKESIKVATIRLVMAALKDRDIAAREKGLDEGISEDEILMLLQGMIKQRNESISLYDQGGRPDLANLEAKEIDIIRTFLPEPLSEVETTEAIEALLQELTSEAEASLSVRDMGRVMTELRARHVGRMDFSKASGIVRQKLIAS
ncbi:MAG: GatB/YqeY domain-containing protein [Alphaproteobacteria bacterium]|jgi:uncharacterized protein|nr:GatB/YqeY domain-containing protein [Alphaproteobacteria bacterium]MBT5390418.1 GatB/YqeY domain-containing protein [Alphaproteobacteria bacterium]